MGSLTEAFLPIIYQTSCNYVLPPSEIRTSTSRIIPTPSYAHTRVRVRGRAMTKVTIQFTVLGEPLYHTLKEGMQKYQAPPSSSTHYEKEAATSLDDMSRIVIGTSLVHKAQDGSARSRSSWRGVQCLMGDGHLWNPHPCIPSTS